MADILQTYASMLGNSGYKSLNQCSLQVQLTGLIQSFKDFLASKTCCKLIITKRKKKYSLGIFGQVFRDKTNAQNSLL